MQCGWHRLGIDQHDERMLGCDDLRRIAPELTEIMVGAYELKACLHVDLKMGLNWEDMKPLAVPSLARA